MTTAMKVIISIFLPVLVFGQVSNIAVLNLDMTGGVPNTYQLTLSDRLRQELHNTGKFNVMERYKMEDILKEQAFQITGCVSTECAVDAGKILGVNYIVAGSAGKVGSTYTLNIRMIEIETSRIVKTESVDCPYEIDVVLTEGLEDAARLIAGLSSKVRTHRKSDYKYSETPSTGSSGYWTIGSTEEEVKRIQGTPDKISGNYMYKYWYYGLSYVSFNNGHVESYNNVGKTLKVR